MFKVNYFKNTRSFYEDFSPNDDELHITQSASLAEYLRKSKGTKGVFAYKLFYSFLFPEWNHPHTEVYFRSVIREYLIKHVSPSHYSYLKKHLDDFYKSFMFLIEIGLIKLDVFESLLLTDEQRLLAEMMDTLKQDPIVQRYFEAGSNLTKENLSQLLGIRHPINTVYIHHCDYIDATRMMLFHKLDSLGVKVIFLIPYNDEFPELYHPWEVIYKNLSGKGLNQWECVGLNGLVKGMKFAHYLKLGVPNDLVDLAKVGFKVFNHPTSFKEYINKYPIFKDSHDIITIVNEELNLYTDQSRAHHFYATTYGKFFLALENVRKTKEEIFCSFDDYVNMMISGWVQSGNVNGKQALSILIDLKDYMDGVQGLKEIMERLQALVDLQEVSIIFDDISKEQTGRNRLKRYLSNPFRVFPYIHSLRYDITLRQLIDCTKDLAKKLNQLLLQEDETRNVQSYLSELNNIYQSVKENWNSDATNKFEALFKTDIPTGWQFRKEEMFHLLSFYLASDCHDEEKIEDFDQLVGKTLSSNHIHVTGLSFQTFPWKTPNLPLLLNHTWLKHSIYQSNVSKNREIRLNALLVDFYSRKLTRNRALYAIFHLIAFSKGEVTLSYIDHLREHDSPSIYFTILEELYHSGSDPKTIPDSESYDWDINENVKEERLPLQVFETIPDLLWLDSDFCGKKFFLNAFIEEHPVYESDFHQQIAFSTIGKLLAEQGDGVQEVRENIFPLFPQWTNAHKQNLLDTAKVSGLRNYKSYENIYYPFAMKRLQLLYSRYEVGGNWKAKNQYDKDRFNLEQHVDDFISQIGKKNVKANAGLHCRMCPYLHVCKEGEFVIDANDS
jgi:hypothetical protein